MMKESIYVLAESNSNYDNFFEIRGERFKKIEIFSVKEYQKKELKDWFSNFLNDQRPLHAEPFTKYYSKRPGKRRSTP